MDVSLRLVRQFGWLVAGLFLAHGSSAVAAPIAAAVPMYSVTDLGPNVQISSGYGNNGGFSAFDPQANKAVPISFPVSITPFAATTNTAILPSTAVSTNSLATESAQRLMSVFAANSQGTVIGGLPVGTGPNPSDTLKLGYTQLQPNGTYSPFQAITSPFDAAGWQTNDSNTRILLNNQNQIFASGPSFWNAGGITKDGVILDLNAKTTTPLDSMLPASLLAKYDRFNFIGFADNGSLIGTAGLSTDPGGPHGIMLTLPGISASPVPEPSTFVVLAGGLGAIAFARRFRRQSQNRD